MIFRRNKLNHEIRYLSGKRLILWLALFFLVVGQILLTIHTTSTGVRLSDLEKREQELIVSKRRLEAEVVSLSSVTDLQKKATELGFVKIEKTKYIELGDFTAGITR